ncbi:hypothetical protein [Plantibacter sp. MPB07]|uniref:hypothetical protein n=1 Tax=Plantibacter sp. MPB07 TaxID=3388853 RepID=UPI003988913B
MAGIEFEVLDTFLSDLTGIDEVPEAVTDALAKLLASEKLPKPEVLVSLYTEASGELAL